MNIRTLIAAVSLGLSLGSGSSKVLMANETTANNPLSYNVYYDLACLYGDSNSDGVLTDSEYLNFNINSLCPSPSMMENTDFKFLGFNPIDESHMCFYVYTNLDLKTFDLIKLNYVNGINEAVDSDGDPCYSDDTIVTSNAVLNSEYQVVFGYFSKLVINDYQPKEDDGDMRICAESLYCYTESTLSDDFSIDYGGELFYNKSAYYSAPYTTNPISEYFGTRTYEITGDLYGMMATTRQNTTASGSVCFIPTGTESYPTEAKEVYYYFFSFDDSSFNPEYITSVSYSCQLLTFTQKSYYGEIDSFTTTVGNKSPRIYQGTYADSNSGKLTVHLNQSDNAYYYFSSSLKKSENYKTTTAKRVEEITQTDTRNVWLKHKPIIRKYKLSTIVNTGTYSSDFSGDDFANFRGFVSDCISSGSSKNRSYQWAYAVENDDWKRTLVSCDNYWTGTCYYGGRNCTETVSQSITTCHEPTELVTLMMHTVTDGVGDDIKVFNNPATVRKNFMVGYKAPKLIDFVSNDISSWIKENTWIWWVIGIAALLVLIILMNVFPPILKAIGFVFKAIWWIIKAVIDLAYIILVWWWYALVCKATGRDVPSAWFWD